MAVNGKAKAIVGGSVAAIGIPAYLIISIFTMNNTLTATEVRSKYNKQHVQKLEKVPEQLARVEEGLGGLKEDFLDDRQEQRKVNDKLYEKLDGIANILIAR